MLKRAFRITKIKRSTNAKQMGPQAIISAKWRDKVYIKLQRLHIRVEKQLSGI